MAAMPGCSGRSEFRYIIVSGSLPLGLPVDLIARIARIANRKNQKLIVDTNGLPLKHALEEGVYMIKPNLSELSVFLDGEATLETGTMIAKEIVNKGLSQIVVVSLGASGALLVTENKSVQFIPPAVRKISTVGAGDSMVASIVWKLSNGWTVKESVQYGVACGTAATMNPATELCHLNDADKLFNSMQKAILV